MSFGSNTGEDSYRKTGSKRSSINSISDSLRYSSSSNQNTLNTQFNFKFGIKSPNQTFAEDCQPLLSEPMEDPFYSVRDQVQTLIDKMKVRFERFQDMIRNSDVSNNAEFKELRRALVKDLRSAERDVRGLRDAVENVEKNRLKFPQIKDNELASRKKSVTDMQSTVQEVKSYLDSPAVRQKIDNDENKAKRQQYDESVNSLNQVEEENSRFIDDQQQRTKKMISNQDVALVGLGQAVDRLETISKSVNEELKDQERMLNKLDDDLDSAGNKMNVVMASLSKLLKTKDNCQIWTIVILFAILVILVALIIWT